MVCWEEVAGEQVAADEFVKRGGKCATLLPKSVKSRGRCVQRAKKEGGGMQCKHETKQSIVLSMSTGMEWSALVIGLFGSFSCFGARGGEECSRQAFG